MMSNKTLKFTIKTKSDLILATGKSSTSYIDSEMDFDEYGFPYISAKRFKGLLCHSAKQICSMPYFKLKPNDVKNIIFNVFGSSTKEGVCIFDNVCIQKYTENREYYERILKLNPSLLTRIDLINAISSLRTQTSIDETINIAKNQSLRTIRVLHRDYDFEGYIEITKDIHCCYNINASYLITLSLLNLRRIGLGRNRGFGEIQCSVKKSSAHGYTKEDIVRLLEGVNHAPN